jgi:aspartyl-tRNA(Asn)/glutamyl-tRNA(Gln) amidotransferase subunit A
MPASMTDGIFLARPERPAAGIPLAVKDLFDTGGLTTTYGSALFADHVPAKTAEAVRLLEAAGYANVGKANLHEFAYGVTSENPHYGWVPNPLAPGRIAGGSSGGSAAALAAGLADAALGSDSGGSIRIPAAFCGVVGFKPTHGLVSLAGCWPLAPSYDHAGPMARDVAACAAMMRPLAGLEAAEVDLADVRVGVAETWIAECDALVAARLREAAALFPDRVAVEFPIEASDDDYRLFMYEVARVHEDLYAEHADEYGEDLARRVSRALEVTRAEADAAAERREAYRETCESIAAEVDLLLFPTQPFVAPISGQTADDRLRGRIIRFTYPFDVLGWPALALPCGRAEHGLPASVQLVAPAGADALVLGAAAALERALVHSG